MLAFVVWIFHCDTYYNISFIGIHHHKYILLRAHNNRLAFCKHCGREGPPRSSAHQSHIRVSIAHMR